MTFFWLWLDPRAGSIPLLYAWLKMLGVDALRNWLRFTTPNTPRTLSFTLRIMIPPQTQKLHCGYSIRKNESFEILQMSHHSKTVP